MSDPSVRVGEGHTALTAGDISELLIFARS
jgi:hypothetical protein